MIQYKKILDYLEYHDAKADGDEAERKILEDSKKLKLAGCLNLALCYNKLKQYKDAIDVCVEVMIRPRGYSDLTFTAGDQRSDLSRNKLRLS